MARFFKIPFSATGNRTVTPDATQPDGSVSYSEGFGFDYERPNTDPAYKPVPRDGMNGLLYDITEAIGIVQKQGAADWAVNAVPYAINARVRHSDKYWVSTIPNNSDEPGGGAGWAEIGGPSSQVEAEAGTENTKFATSLRVFQAIRSIAANATESLRGVLRIGTQAEINAGTLDDVVVTPKKLRLGFQASLTPNGYIVFPSWLGSVVFQWGLSAAIPDDSKITVPFNLQFPVEAFVVLASNQQANTVNGGWILFIESMTASSFVVGADDVGTSSGQAVKSYWFSVGR